MKRKITYGLLIILLLGGLYFGLRFAFGFFTPFNFLAAGQDIKNGEIQIIEIGEKPLNFEQKQKLANSYGFDFYLYGCDISPDILNGTEYYNKKMVNYLESKYGSGWWTKFQTQLDSIDNIYKTEINKPKTDCSFENILSDPKTPKLAIELFNNTAKYSEEPLEYFDNLMSKDKEKREFYFKTITNSYQIADGAYSEGLGNFGKEFIENNPKEFATFFDNKNCFTDNDLKIWAKIALLEFQIIDDNIEAGKGESIVSKYSKKLLIESKNYTDNQKETIRKFTEYLKKEWNEFMKSI